MNKKTISLLRLAVCMALVMTLFICAAAPSLAVNYGTINDQDALVGTEQNPADAAITKIFSKGQGSATPSATFRFIFEPVSIDDNPNLKDYMPDIPDAVINYSSSDTVTSSQLAWNANQTDYMPKQTQPIFKNIDWGRSGIFLYKVYEEQSGVTITDSSRQTVYYSQAVYEITVYVAEKENQAGSFYVWAIGAKRIKTDTGSTTGSEVGVKVDPRPDGDPDKPNLGKYSKLIFSNDYLKHGSGDPDDPEDMMLKVSKTTKGLGSNSSLFFNFNITIEKPIKSQKTVYTVYVFETPNGGGRPSS